MFGYVIINKPELKFKEYDVYKSYYCGLCKAIKIRGGNLARLSLSYDMTFVYMLLTGLYEPKTVTQRGKCVFHPIRRPVVSFNKISNYVADMSVLMTYYKCRDDWNDEKKFTAKLMMSYMDLNNRGLLKKYPKKIANIASYMEKLDRGEKDNNTNLDEMAGYFGHIMEEIFLYRADQWSKTLGRMGFFLGKYIYILDAYDDLEDDIKNKRYNPLIKIKDENDFDDTIRNILIMMMSECSREFEKLPILQNAEILRNILYSGIWIRFETARKKRNEDKNDRSV